MSGHRVGPGIRNYLRVRWDTKCAYCEAEKVPLNVDHLQPKSRGGSNRISNLALACYPCNIAKANYTIQEFLANDLSRLAYIIAQAKLPLKDAVNADIYRDNQFNCRR